MVNLVEEAAKESITNYLNIRFDICTCNICRQDILKEVLNRVSEVSPTAGQLNGGSALQQISSEKQNEINRAILEAIEKISSHPSHIIIDDKKKAFKALIEKILKERSVDFRNYHHDLLKRRFAIRIRTNNLGSYADYMKYLEKNPREYDRLFETLCINVSEFFRDPPVWITVQHLLDTLIKNKIEQEDSEIQI